MGTRTARSVSPSLSCCDPGAPARRPPASGVQGRGALHTLARAQVPQQSSGQPSRPGPGPGSERPPAQPITADITREQLRGPEEDAACSQCFFLQRWLGHLGEDNEQEADAREGVTCHRCPGLVLRRARRRGGVVWGRQRVAALPVGVVPTLSGQGLGWSSQAQAPVFLSQSPRWPWNSGGHQSYCLPGGLTNPETTAGLQGTWGNRQVWPRPRTCNA